MKKHLTVILALMLVLAFILITGCKKPLVPAGNIETKPTSTQP